MVTPHNPSELIPLLILLDANGASLELEPITAFLPILDLRDTKIYQLQRQGVEGFLPPILSRHDLVLPRSPVIALTLFLIVIIRAAYSLLTNFILHFFIRYESRNRNNSHPAIIPSR